MNIVVLGPPGSGKGTQSKRIAAFYDGTRVVDCGKLLRSASLDSEMKARMSVGALLDDEFVISVVRKELFIISSSSHNFILDGFPRSIAQCNALFEIINELETSISCVVKLELADDIIFTRLGGRLLCAKCGDLFDTKKMVCGSCCSTEYKRRSDDTDAFAIKERIFSYKRYEGDILGLFKENDIKILSVSSSPSPDEVTNDLRNQLLIFA